MILKGLLAVQIIDLGLEGQSRGVLGAALTFDGEKQQLWVLSEAEVVRYTLE